MEGKPDNRIKRELDKAFFANQEAKALQADLWMWGSVNVKNTFFREQIINMAKKKLPNVTVKIPEKTALDIAPVSYTHLTPGKERSVQYIYI